MNNKNNKAVKTRHHGLAFTLVMYGLLGMPCAAKADIQSIRSFDSAVSASFGAFHFNYKETVTGIPDSERGWTPSGALGASYMTTKLNLYAAIEGSIAYGGVPYSGAYLYFPTVPVYSTTHETISTVDGRFGKGFALNNYLMLIPYVELGARFWDRNLGGGQIEDYQNLDALGGAMLQFSPIKSVLLSAYVSAGSTFSAKMKASPTTYTLGDSAMYKVGGKIGYEFTRRFEIFSTFDYDHFRFGQSAIAADTSYEPTSNTEDTTARVGIAYHFE